MPQPPGEPSPPDSLGARYPTSQVVVDLVAGRKGRARRWLPWFVALDMVVVATVVGVMGARAGWFAAGSASAKVGSGAVHSIPLSAERSESADEYGTSADGDQPGAGADGADGDDGDDLVASNPRSALLLSGDWQLAEDLVQTTLAKLFVGWGRVRKADNREAYAQGTLTKTFLSYKRLRRNTETPTDAVAQAAAPKRDLDEHIDLFAALGALEQRDRTLVVLRYWEDWSVSDTAQQMQLSEAAVRTRSSRAMAKLREALAPATEATA